MNKEAAQYIERELDLSRLRLSSLAESLTLSEAAKKRLMDIETDLQSLDFSSLDIKTQKDAESAIRLFRTSRKNFSSIYGGNTYRSLDDFYNFIEEEAKISEEKIKLSELKIKLKRKIIARSVLKILNGLQQRKIDKEIRLDIINLLLDNDKSKIFSLYNDSLEDILLELEKKGVKQPKISPLINLVREHEQEKELQVENIVFYGKNRLGIILPKDEASRETLWVLYKKISIFNNDLSNIFEDNVSNVNIDGRYQKAILLKNKDEVLQNKDISKYYFLLSLFFQNSLSNRHKANVVIDKKNSSILITRSRTDDNTLKKILNDFIVDAKKH